MSTHSDPAQGVETVALNTNLNRNCRGLYVGTTGNVNVLASDGSTALLTNVQGGTVLPIRVRQVLSSGTTASGLVALY